MRTSICEGYKITLAGVYFQIILGDIENKNREE